MIFNRSDKMTTSKVFLVFVCQQFLLLLIFCALLHSTESLSNKKCQEGMLSISWSGDFYGESHENSTALRTCKTRSEVITFPSYGDYMLLFSIQYLAVQHLPGKCGSKGGYLRIADENICRTVRKGDKPFCIVFFQRETDDCKRYITEMGQCDIKILKNPSAVPIKYRDDGPAMYDPTGLRMAFAMINCRDQVRNYFDLKNIQRSSIPTKQITTSRKSLSMKPRSYITKSASNILRQPTFPNKLQPFFPGQQQPVKGTTVPYFRRHSSFPPETENYAIIVAPVVCILVIIIAIGIGLFIWRSKTNLEPRERNDVVPEDNNIISPYAETVLPGVDYVEPVMTPNSHPVRVFPPFTSHEPSEPNNSGRSLDSIPELTDQDGYQIPIHPRGYDRWG